MWKEEAPSDWRPEGPCPPIGVGPEVDEGARPGRRGGAGDLSITEFAGGKLLPHRSTSWRRGWEGQDAAFRRRSQTGGSQSAGPSEGAGAGSSHTTQTHGPGRTLEPQGPSAFRCEARGASSLLGDPHLSNRDHPHHPPLPASRRAPPSCVCVGARACREGSPKTVAGKRAPPLLSSRATRFCSRLRTAGWLRGGGKVAPAEAGRAPPTQPRAAVGAGGWRR